MTGPADRPGSRWQRIDEPDLARNRLLDAAGEVFSTKGVGAVTVSDVAAAAGCTRGTVHRHFGDRDGVRRAFVEREAVRISVAVAGDVAAVDDPERLVVDGVLAAVRHVRARPVLAAWFAADAAGLAGQIAARADLVTTVAEGWAEALVVAADRAGRWRPGTDPTTLADGMVRLILSLLALPGADDAAEERLVRILLVPALLRDGAEPTD